MPRYIDADELKRLSIKFGEEQGKQRFSELLCEYIDCIPTADVVPKSEVENVIDEFIQKVCEKYEIWTDSDEREYRYTLNLMEEAKAELKKKYTGEG